VKFKLDENLPTELAADLRTLGHDAETVLDEGLRGGRMRRSFEWQPLKPVFY